MGYKQLIMHIIQLDFNDGAVLVDSAPITVLENDILIGSIAKLCSPPMHTTQGLSQYRLLRKASVSGKLADGIIEVGHGKTFSVTFLFDLMEFFEFSILESKVIKSFDKFSNLKFISNHPSTAFLDSCKWGSATFFYDAKQGDLSLEIRFERVCKEQNFEARLGTAASQGSDPRGGVQGPDA